MSLWKQETTFEATLKGKIDNGNSEAFCCLKKKDKWSLVGLILEGLETLQLILSLVYDSFTVFPNEIIIDYGLYTYFCMVSTCFETTIIISRVSHSP